MIDTPLHKLTADAAVELGLIEAVKSGEAKITGIYLIGKDCKVNFKQQNFFFTNKFDEVILAKFENNAELFKFWEKLGELNEEDGIE